MRGQLGGFGFAKSLSEVMISVWQSLDIRGWVCHLDDLDGKRVDLRQTVHKTSGSPACDL